MSIGGQSRFSAAGFFLGPLAWAIHQQVGYMLVPISCQMRLTLVPAITLATALLALAGAWLSWTGRFGLTEQEDPEPAIRTHRFIAALSLLSATIFLFLILVQGAASLILDGCQR